MLWYIVLLAIVGLDFLLERLFILKGNANKLNEKLNFIFKYRILTVCALVFYSTFKSYSIGMDNFGYINYYTELKLNKKSLFTHHMANKFEIGYTFLNSIIAAMNLNFRFVLFVISIIVSVIVVLFVNKISPNKIMSIMLYITLGTFAQSMSLYRQIIAMGFVMLAVMMLVDKKLVKSFILIVIGATFHISAIICLVLIPLRYLKPKWWVILGAFVITIVGSLVFPYILRFVENVSPLDYYTKYYIEINKYIVKSDMLNILYSIALIVIFFVMYICKFKLLKFNELEQKIYDFFLLIFMFVPLFRVAGFIINMPQLFNRLNIYFFMILIVLIPLFIKGLTHNKHLHITAIAMANVTAICFMVYLYAIKNSCGVYPFQFMF